MAAEEPWMAVTAGVRILGRLDLAVSLLSATMARRGRLCIPRSDATQLVALGDSDAA
jgi:hypothetical protein